MTTTTEAQHPTRSAICETHGEYIQTGFEIPKELGGRTVWSKCGKCIQEAEEKRNASAEQSKYQMIMAYSDVPNRYAKKTLGNYDVTGINSQAMRIVTSYAGSATAVSDAADHGRCLIIAGTYGTGKTHLAVGVIKAFAKAGNRVLYTTMADMLCQYKSSFDRSGPKETEMLSYYRNPKLLVIDEVGLHRGTEEDMRIISNIIDGRYAAMRCTVIVSNCTMDELTAQLGDRVIDRLRENGGKLAVFTGDSQRGSVGNE